MLLLQKMKIILLLLVISNTLFAQQKAMETNTFLDEIPAEVEDQLFRVDFFVPGFQYEKRLSKSSTIQAAISLGSFGRTYFTSTDQKRFDFGILPQIEAGYRYYYNLEKRKKTFNNFTNNSGSYVGPKFQTNHLFYTTKTINEYSSFTLGGVWGFQKNVEPVTLNLEMGIGYRLLNIDYIDADLIDVFEGKVKFLSKFTLGVLIGKRNKAYKNS